MKIGMIGLGKMGSTSLADLAGKLDSPKAVWVMLPAGHITDSTVEERGTSSRWCTTALSTG